MGDVVGGNSAVVEFSSMDIRGIVRDALVDDISIGIIPCSTYLIGQVLSFADPDYVEYGIPGLTVATAPLTADVVKDHVSFLNETWCACEYGYVIKSHLPQAAIDDIARKLAADTYVYDKETGCEIFW